MTDPRRSLPSVDALLSSEPFRALQDRYPRARIVGRLRERLDAVRAQVGPAPEDHGSRTPEVWAGDVARMLEADEVPSLRRVINATGVVLHTNLGRAPLADAARLAMVDAALGYANLEYDLDEGVRGSRYDHCTELFKELTGAEAALVVNNAAAGLLLALNTCARGRGVAVSRGELVEIGGGFRIPEVLERSGARLVEVGSTNRTRTDDYATALDEQDVAALLKVHRSNFRMSGFTEDAPLAELADVAHRSGVPLIYDLGSGLFADPSGLGLPPEPRPGEALQGGADVVVVSGDKLFGGPQAGIIVGRADLVAEMRRNPMCRALRVDKVTLAGLEATARLYRDPERALSDIPTLRMLREGEASIRSRAEALVEKVAAALGGDPDGVSLTVQPSEGAVGGGTYPDVTLDSWAVVIDVTASRGGDRPSASQLAARFRAGDPPVVARIEDDRVVLDVRTVYPDETEALARRIAEVLSVEAR